MKSRAPVAAVLVVAMAVSSCAENGPMSKAQVGAAVGALTGAAVGASVSHDKGKGALVGALVGGLVGGGIGKVLDDRDKARLAASTEQTITTGTAQSWTNPETGVTAKTQVKSTVAQTEQRQIPVLKGKVQQVPPLEFIGEDYTTTKAANVRGGPGTDYEVVSKLTAGQNTRVVGKVVNQPWYMVAENNVGSGFVSADLLKPGGAPAVAPKNAAPAAPAIVTPPADISQATVAGTSTCRVVTQQVTLKDGQTSTEDVKACRGPNGWEIMEA
jgi:surface antigen